jgi:hypothetical protein
MFSTWWKGGAPAYVLTKKIVIYDFFYGQSNCLLPEIYLLMTQPAQTATTYTFGAPRTYQVMTFFFADGLGHWCSVLSSVELVNYPKQEDDHINLLLWTWGFLLTIDIYPFFLPADVEELLARYGGLDIGNNPWYFHRRFMEPSSFINWNLHII